MKACWALADAYHKGFLPGAGDGTPASPDGRYYTFFQRVIDDMSGSMTPATDSSGVPASVGAGQARAQADTAQLAVDVDNLTADPVPIPGSVTGRLISDCGAFGVRWSAG